MENELLLIEHPERGDWYFTNLQKAADWVGISRTLMVYYMAKKNPEYKDYKFRWVDGSNIIYKYIDPTK